MKNKFKIKFVGARKGLEPLKTITDGRKLITLPSNQSRPFAHPDWRAILQHSPEAYKKVIPLLKKK